MKVAICGVWHVHATGYAKTAMETENVEVIGFFEENQELRDAFKKEVDLPAFDTFEELLNSNADSVIVCSSSDTHADYMVRLAEAKKDIFTEKVLALTADDCAIVKKAVEENGVRFVISYVWKMRSEIRTLKALADSGELGKLNFMRFRNCHSGSVANWLPQHFYSKKQCGGGAMIDLGAHGMYLIEWFLGLPVNYSSTFTIWDDNDKNVDRIEDNAVTVMSYEDGTIAINETGFVSAGSPVILEIGGDKGFARYVQGEGITGTVDLLDELPSPLQSFLAGETPSGCGIEEAVHLTQMMEGAYKDFM